jgi:hypothetical protein
MIAQASLRCMRLCKGAYRKIPATVARGNDMKKNSPLEGLVAGPGLEPETYGL